MLDLGDGPRHTGCGARPGEPEALDLVAAEACASSSHVARVSTPSATTRSPRPWARSMVLRTMICVTRGRAAIVVHEGPVDLELVLTGSRGQVGERGSTRCRSRRPRGARRAPAARAGPRGPAPDRFMAALSVISSSRQDAGETVRVQQLRRPARGATSPTRLRAERLTATVRSPSGTPPGRTVGEGLPQHRRRSAAGSGRSAPRRGMKAAGGTRPRSGWSHRTRASTPTTRPCSSVHLGLVVHQRDRRRGWPAAVPRRRRAARRHRHPGSAGRRRRPSVIALRRVHGHVGVPQQVGGGSAVGGARRSWRRSPAGARRPGTGRRRAWRARPATSSAAGGSQSGSRTTNSSPPRRASVASLRSCVASAGRPTAVSSTSPTWWPRVSLTSLKRSRSMSTTATGEPAATARVDLVASADQLTSPVRASCRARWRSSRAATRRNSTSALSSSDRRLPKTIISRWEKARISATSSSRAAQQLRQLPEDAGHRRSRR